MANKNKQKPYVIYTTKMVKYLDSKGFKYFAYRQDKRCTDNTIFLYEYSPQIEEAVQAYIENHTNP